MKISTLPVFLACLCLTCLLSACTAAAAPVLPTFTPLPPTMQLPPTAAPTLIPEPTATPTFAPTATWTSTPIATATLVAPISNVVPKPGHWEGEPGVSFDLSSDGQIKNFTMTVPFGKDEFGPKTCALIMNDKAIEGNQLVFITQSEVKKFVFDMLSSFLSNPNPTPVAIATTEDTAIIEIQKISGTFYSPTAIKGIYLIYQCGSTIQGQDINPWRAEWKQP